MAISHDSSFNLSGNFSISGWFKVEGNGSGDAAGSAISKWWDGSTRSFNLKVQTDEINFVWRPSGDSADSRIEKTGLSLNDGYFHHIVVLYNGTAMKLYIDGVEEDSETAGTIEDNTADLGIGKHIHISLDGFYSGKILNVMIFDRALSANEIKALYEQTYIE